jgi:hypothetical protein
VGAVAVGASGVTVHDGPDTPELHLHSCDAPTSIAWWRNLGGFPDNAPPYRSIGVEPMLGRVFDLAEATEQEDVATVPSNGILEWKLTINCVTP